MDGQFGKHVGRSVCRPRAEMTLQSLNAIVQIVEPRTVYSFGRGSIFPKRDAKEAFSLNLHSVPDKALIVSSWVSSGHGWPPPDPNLT